MSKKSKSKRAVQQGVDRVQKENHTKDELERKRNR